MLRTVKCDAFADDLRNMTIRPGLNIVQGSSQGNNAIGKSTFLWIVDFIFGGDRYAKIAQDVRKHIDRDLTVYFTFEVDEKPRYFYRKPEEPQKIFECTQDWKTIIDEMAVEQYQSFLRDAYRIDLPGLTIPGLTDHFFRIYGKGNVDERKPIKGTKDTHDTAVDFLLVLFNHGRMLAEIAYMEQTLNIKAYEDFLKNPAQAVDYAAKLEENSGAIKAMQERLDRLLRKEGGEIEFADLGMDTKTIETVAKLQKELRLITRQYESLRSQQVAVENNLSETMTERAEEFTALQHFFPQANIKAFEDIESFHRQLRQILRDEMKDEIARLQPLITFYSEEIRRLEARIQESGITRSISEKIMSQCVSARQRLEELQAERDQLFHDKELQEERAEKMAHLRELAEQHRSAITSVEETVTNLAETINAAVTAGKEKAPVLKIASKDLPFGTEENTSEGSAFKNLVIYDLCLANSCPIPVLIHDSNILIKIDNAYLEEILRQYQATGKQVFIVLDKLESVSPGTQAILDDTTLMHLSDGHELFGTSWSKVAQKATDEAKETEDHGEDQ